MPNERPKRESVAPLRRKIAKWTGIATSISTAIAGIVLLSAQTCSEIRSAKTQAVDSQEKAEAGYEALQPAVGELMSIAVEASEWAEDTDEEIDELQDEIDDLRMELARHDVYFELLKERNRDLRDAPRVAAAMQPEPPEPWHAAKPVKVKASKPKLDAPPKDLKSAVQMQKRLFE
jgi:predicted  nucleic acid-binding Zn-ribbon protein